MRTTERPRWMLVSLFIAAVVIAYALCELKWRSLNFHTRDYPYYLQFAAQLFDPSAAHAYSLNPHGHNWLMYRGIEGVSSFHQAIHFEPVKYLYALLYRLTGTPRSLFLLTSLVTFLPVLWLSRSRRAGDAGLGPTSVALLYVLLPPMLYSPGFDLRPYHFLAPLFFLAFLAITHARPIWETVFWFNTMFLAREEAIVLGVFLIAYAAVRTEVRSRRKLVLWLIGSLFSWTAVTVLFFQWTGYTSEFGALVGRLFTSRAWWAVLVVAIVLSLMWVRRRDLLVSLRQRPWIKEALIFGAILIPLGYQFITAEAHHFGAPSSEWIGRIIFTPRYAIYYVVVLCLVILVSAHGKMPRLRRWLLPSAMGAMAVLVASVCAATCMRQAADLTKTRDVLQMRTTMGGHATGILTGFPTYQAFCDLDHVYVYARLPWSMAQGEARIYPQNTGLLRQLIRERIGYVIVTRPAYAKLEPLIREAGSRSEEVFGNERFIGVKLVRE